LLRPHEQHAGLLRLGPTAWQPVAIPTPGPSRGSFFARPSWLRDQQERLVPAHPLLLITLGNSCTQVLVGKAFPKALIPPCLDNLG
jgi:hypothetical protein